MLYGLNLKEKFNMKIFLAKPDKSIIAKLNEAYGIDTKVRLKEINEFQFSIPAKVELQGKLQKNPNLELLRERYLIKVVIGDSSEWFTIVKTDENGDDVDSKTVQCYSLPYQMKSKRLRTYKVESKNPEQVLTDVLDKTGWKIGYIESEFLTKYRSFDVSSQNRLDFLFDMNKTYDSTIIWDTHSKEINLLKFDNIGKNRGLKIKYGKYLKSLGKTNDSNEQYTIIKAFGKDGMSINRVNPTGQNYIEDFSYFIYPFERNESRQVLYHSHYMSDELCHALLDYQELSNIKDGEFTTLFDQLENKQVELIPIQNELSTLQNELQIILDQIETETQAGHDVTVLTTQRDLKQGEVDAKQIEVDSIQGEIDNLNTQILNLRNLLSLENNFTAELLEERYNYEFEYEFADDKYQDENDLLDAVKKKIEEFKKPLTTFSINIVNFLEIVECKGDWDKLNVGDIVSIEYEQFNIKDNAKIIGYDIDYDDYSINLILSNVEKVETDDDKLEGLLNNIITTNKTIDINKIKWNQAEENSKSYVDNKIDEVNDNIENLYTNLDRSSADGYITLAEAKTLENNLAQLNSESIDLINVATNLNIVDEKNNYATALSDLSNGLGKWIGQSNYPIIITLIDRNNLQQLFNNVQDTKSKLINKINSISVQNAENNANDYTDNVKTDLQTQINQTNEAITLKADKTVTDGLNTRLTSAEQKITDDAIISTVRSSSGYTSDLNNKANQIDLNQTNSRLTTAESSITQNANNINLKVSVDNVVSEINQSAEAIKIQASKIDILGEANIPDLQANKIVGGTLTLGGINNSNGNLQLKDASGKKVLEMNKDIDSLYNIRALDSNNNKRAVFGEYEANKYGLGIFNQYGELVTSSERPSAKNVNGVGVAGCYVSLNSITTGIVGETNIISVHEGTTNSDGADPDYMIVSDSSFLNVGESIFATKSDGSDYRVYPQTVYRKESGNKIIASVSAYYSYHKAYKLIRPTANINISEGFIINDDGRYIKVNSQTLSNTQLGYTGETDYDGFVWYVVYIDDNGLAHITTKGTSGNYSDIEFIGGEAQLQLSALPDISGVNGVIVGAILSGIPKHNNIFSPNTQFVHQIVHDPSIRKQIPYYVNESNKICSTNIDYAQWNGNVTINGKSYYTIAIPIGENKKSAMLSIATGNGQTGYGFFGLIGRKNYYSNSIQYFMGQSAYSGRQYNGGFFDYTKGETIKSLTDVYSIDGSYWCISDAYIVDTNSGQSLKIILWNGYSSSLSKNIYINTHAF